MNTKSVFYFKYSEVSVTSS